MKRITSYPISRRVHFIVLVPTPYSNSPAMDLMGVAAHLQERGHSVLVVSTHRAAFAGYLARAAARHTSNTTAEAMQFLAAEGDPAAAGSSQAADKEQQPPRPAAPQRTWKVPHSWLGQALLGPQLILAMRESMARLCAQIVLNATVMQRLREFEADAILPMVLLPTGPSLARDGCGCVLSAALGGTPYVEVDAPLATLWAGNPLATPQFGAGVTAAELQRPWQHLGAWLRNAATWAALQLLPAWADMFPPQQVQTFAAIRSSLSLPPAASYSCLTDALLCLAPGSRAPSRRCRPLLRVLPGSWLLEYPRPLQPWHVLVGPGSPRPAQPLTSPADAAAFVQAAADGLVLVGFGTGTISNDSAWLRLLDFQELARGFASLAPVRVLWNLQGGLPAGAEGVQLGGNTLVVGFIDYNDVLGHPHTRAFVSHCGLHSAYEAMYHGVPLVGVPFMFEQVHTCSKLAGRGAAVVSPEAPAFRTPPFEGLRFTAQGVAGLISQVLSNASYADAAAGAAHALQVYGSRRHPYAHAADAIEVALAGDRVSSRPGAARLARDAGAAAAGRVEL